MRTFKLDMLGSKLFDSWGDFDSNPKRLSEALKFLTTHDCLRFPGSESESAMAVRNQIFRSVAKYSYPLAFMLSQHEAANKILGVGNMGVDQLFASGVACSDLLGVGVGHLRKADNLALVGSKYNELLYLNGTIPWVSGIGIFDHFILGCQCESKEYYVLVQGGKIFSHPLVNIKPYPKVVVASGCLSTSIEFSNYALPYERVVGVFPAGNFSCNSNRTLRHITLVQGLVDRLFSWVSINKYEGCALTRLLQKQTALDKSVSSKFLAYKELVLFRSEYLKLAYDLLRVSTLLYGGGSVLAGSIIEVTQRDLTQASVIGVDGDLRKLALFDKPL